MGSLMQGEWGSETKFLGEGRVRSLFRIYDLAHGGLGFSLHSSVLVA